MYDDRGGTMYDDAIGSGGADADVIGAVATTSYACELLYDDAIGNDDMGIAF